MKYKFVVFLGFHLSYFFIVSSVNFFKKGIYRHSLKWERFHCDLMSLREFERKLPKKANCKCTLYGIFLQSETIGNFLERIFLFISISMREMKRNNWIRAQFALTFRSEEHQKMEKFKTANNIVTIDQPWATDFWFFA